MAACGAAMRPSTCVGSASTSGSSVDAIGERPRFFRWSSAVLTPMR
jgi:hypothetical protein